MRSLACKFSIVLFLGLIAMISSACALDSASDPVVTPDTTIPSTLKVTVTVTEDQDASDGKYGSSNVTLQFETDEIAESNTVIFTHGERIRCFFNNPQGNNQQGTTVLGDAANYSFHVTIPAIPLTYACDYIQSQNSNPVLIFNITGSQNQLSPVLMRPVGNHGNFKVSYNPGFDITNSSTCKVQVIANAPNASITGSTIPQNGNIYTGPDVSTLSGLGNILMTRTCTPITFNNDNDADDNGSTFDAVNVTYTSTASYEVSWVPPGTT